MKRFLFATLALGLSLSLRAIVPDPHTVSVGFSFTSKGAPSGGGTGLLYVYGESTSSMGSSLGVGANSVESATGTGWLKVDKTYTVTFLTLGCSPSEFQLGFVAPDGYIVLLNNTPVDVYTQSVPPPFTNTCNYSYTIRIEPARGSPGGAAGSFSGLRLGKSVAWEVGLGGLRAGQSAGAIQFREADLVTNAPASRSRLYFSAPANNGQIVTVKSGSDLRQVMTPQVLVDLVDDAGGGYWFKFYQPSQGSWSGSIYNISGSPWRTILVTSPGTSQLTLNETEGSAVRVSAVSLTSGSISSGTYVWTLQEGDGSTWLSTTTHTSTNNGNGTRDDVVVVRTGGTGGTVVAKTKYAYATQGWGEELSAVVVDPDTAQLTTTYTYDTNASPANGGNYRRVKSVTQPTGNWTSYLYYNDWNRRGQLQTRSQPYVDTPSTAQPASTTIGDSVASDYVADWTGRYRIPSSRLIYTTNVSSGKQITTPTLNLTQNSLTFTRYQIDDYSATSTSQQTTTEVIDPRSSNPDYHNLPYAVKRPDLSQDSFAYHFGSYDSGTKTFTSPGDGSHMRTVVLHGSTSSSGADNVTSYAGNTVTSIYLIPNKSTMDVSIRNPAGLVVRTETWIYTGSGNYSLLAGHDTIYDYAGRLTQATASNGATVDYYYTDGRMDYTVDASGTRTEFTYDLLGRVATSVKKGAPASGSYAAQGDITTTNIYDGAGRVTQTVTSSSSFSLTAISAYDLAGRLTQSVAPGNYTTGFAYSSGGRIVTNSLPGGATKVTETYLDGQLKKVTGTAVVSEYFTYNVNSSGRRELIHRQASESGPISEYVYRDWLERQILRQVPSPSGSGYIDQEWLYNSAGQVSAHNQTGRAATLYSYDTLGVLFRECLDVGANGTIDLASSDRITDHAWTYFESSGWWLRETTNTYATMSSGTTTQVGKAEVQLSGFPANRLSRSDSHDIFGNVTTKVVDVNRSGKMVTTAIDAPSSTTDAITVAYNGLLVSAKDTAGITMSYFHDGLGRVTRSVDPRTGSTYTAYKAGTNLVYTVKDHLNITQLIYTYNSAGRIATFGRNGLMSRYEYTPRGQLFRQWGIGENPAEFTYDDWGRQTTMKTFRGGSIAGWTGSVWPSDTGAADTTTWNYHEATGLLSSRTDAANNSVNYSYTQAGQVHIRTWARGATTTYGYSATTGELLTVDYGDNTPDLTYEYNRRGNTSTVVDATGTRSYNFNLAGTLELQSEDLPAFFASRRITYPYATSGVVGRPTGLQLGTSITPTADQSVTYDYALEGRLNSLVIGGQAFAYTYAANSHLIATVTNSVANYIDERIYDPRHNWVDQRETKIGTTSKAKFVNTQDQIGRITLQRKTGEMFNRYGNGVQGLNTSYTYAPSDGQLFSEYTNLGGTSQPPLSGRYQNVHRFDVQGNRTVPSHNGDGAIVYTTNSLNQYSNRVVTGIFDVAGAAATNAIVTINGSTSGIARHGEYFFKKHALSNNPNAVFSTLTISDGTNTSDLPAFLAGTPEAFAYDSDGNMTSDGRWDYAYDAENRLISIQTHIALSPAPLPNVEARRIEFRYDYLGRRIQKTVRDGWNGSGFATVFSDEKFVYDGWNAIAKLDSLNSNALEASYFWGLDLSGSLHGAGGIGGLLMVQEGGNSYLPMYDGMGNIYGLIKAADGTIAAAYEYDAFGQTIRESGSFSASNPFRFSSKYTDIETGLVYYGLRYYSPTLGRFINRDPIEEQGGLNLYGFCGNNGVNRWDYLGNISQDHYFGNRVSEENFLYHGDAMDFKAMYDAQLTMTSWEDKAWKAQYAADMAGPGSAGIIDAIIGAIAGGGSAGNQGGQSGSSPNTATAGSPGNPNAQPTAQSTAAPNSAAASGAALYPDGTAVAYGNFDDPIKFLESDVLTPIAAYQPGEYTPSYTPYTGPNLSQPSQQQRNLDALGNEARNTFDNDVFQKPLATLATAGAQQVVVIGTVTGVTSAATPVVVWFGGLSAEAKVIVLATTLRFLTHGDIKAPRAGQFGGGAFSQMRPTITQVIKQASKKERRGPDPLP